MTENIYQLDFPSHQKPTEHEPIEHRSIIKAIGVGGGGSNAVNHMYRQGIEGVEFVVCNTDLQVLRSSPVPKKIQIGERLTGGLGAGTDPEKGKDAAIENKKEIRDVLAQDTKMIFITAGMGGGTGTGAAPVIAQIAKELEILTVGIVTMPFNFEGDEKKHIAQEGIEELRKYCDTVLVIMNQKLMEIYSDLPFSKAFAQADNVLTTAAKSIAEIITAPGKVNVDFEDVKTVLTNAGKAVMGSTKTIGENRAKRAAEEVLNSPLLDQQSIFGASRILLSIISGNNPELGMDDIDIITNYIQKNAGVPKKVKFGYNVDAKLGKQLSLTVIAAGFDEESIKTEKTRILDLESNKQINSSNRKSSDPRKYSISDTKGNDENEMNYIHNSLLKEIERDVEREDQDKKKLEQTTEKKQENENINEVMLQSKKQKWAEQRAVLEAKYDGKKYNKPSDDEMKELLEKPAYERKGITLAKFPHSSEGYNSKFKMTNDTNTLGNNKFLDDNID